tara:strand:+ start:6538 stop:6837 length:300 start_codon:yes stop_codon:yes gene_type:complete
MQKEKTEMGNLTNNFFYKFDNFETKNSEIIVVDGFELNLRTLLVQGYEALIIVIPLTFFENFSNFINEKSQVGFCPEFSDHYLFLSRYTELNAKENNSI